MIDILIFRTINTILNSLLPSKIFFNKACENLKTYKEIGKVILPKHSLLINIQIKLLNNPDILRILMIIFYRLKQFKFLSIFSHILYTVRYCLC